MLVWTGPEGSARTLVFACGDDGQVDDPVPVGVRDVAHRLGLRVCRVAMDGPWCGDEASDGALRSLIEQAASEATGTLVLAGFSRGARAVAALTNPLKAAGLVVLSYPFHPRRDPHPADRVAALNVGAPVLLVQGSRDALGNREQVRGYGLPDYIDVHWVEAGNHALVPRPSSGVDPVRAWEDVQAAIAAFIQRL